LSEATGRPAVPAVSTNSHIGLKRFYEMHAMRRKSGEIFSSKRMYVEHDYGLLISSPYCPSMPISKTISWISSIATGARKTAISSLYQSELS
jgi:hypothetical protein